MVTSTMEFKEWGETPLKCQEMAGEESEDEAAPGVAGEEMEKGHNMAVVEEKEEAAPSVAEISVEESYSMAGEEEDEAELVVADEANEREENTAREMKDVRFVVKDVEFVPEMAKDYNRFRGDLVEEEEDSVPDPLIPSCVDGVVRLRKEVLEAEGGWPALRNPRVSEIVKKVEAGRSLGSSGDENTIIGGEIVAGGALEKAKNTARRGKRKIRRSEASGWNGGW